MKPDATILAFDFGTRRIGVAMGNTLTRTAHPLTTIVTSRAAQRLEIVGRTGTGAMEIGHHGGNGNGGFIVAAGADGLAQRAAVEPFHEDGIAVDVEDGGGAIAFIPLQQAGAPALLLGNARLQYLEGAEIAAILLDAEDPAPRRIRHRGRLGQGPADHGAAERGFYGRLIHHCRY